MKSIKFPQMFTSLGTAVWKDSEYLQATTQNTKLTLLSDRNTLFGDPYFGLMFKQYLFDQNNYVLRDAIIDMVYTQLALFVPQLYVERRNINIFQDRIRGALICELSGINQIDYTTNTISLVLFEERAS